MGFAFLFYFIAFFLGTLFATMLFGGGGPSDVAFALVVTFCSLVLSIWLLAWIASFRTEKGDGLRMKVRNQTSIILGALFGLVGLGVAFALFQMRQAFGAIVFLAVWPLLMVATIMFLDKCYRSN